MYINTDSGRVQRPLLVIEDGKLKLTEEHLKLVKEGDKSLQSLLGKEEKQTEKPAEAAA